MSPLLEAPREPTTEHAIRLVSQLTLIYTCCLSSRASRFVLSPAHPFFNAKDFYGLQKACYFHAPLESLPVSNHLNSRYFSLWSLACCIPVHECDLKGCKRVPSIPAMVLGMANVMFLMKQISGPMNTTRKDKDKRKIKVQNYSKRKGKCSRKQNDLCDSIINPSSLYCAVPSSALGLLGSVYHI